VPTTTIIEGDQRWQKLGLKKRKHPPNGRTKHAAIEVGVVAGGVMAQMREFGVPKRVWYERDQLNTTSQGDTHITLSRVDKERRGEGLPYTILIGDGCKCSGGGGGSGRFGSEQSQVECGLHDLALQIQRSEIAVGAAQALHHRFGDHVTAR
jgi:hypothetical protein